MTLKFIGIWSERFAKEIVLPGWMRVEFSLVDMRKSIALCPFVEEKEGVKAFLLEGECIWRLYLFVSE